jgi:nucleoside-diphosphate-sugar epimerase
VKGNANLLAAARKTKCFRYVLQSSAFWYAPGPALADETAPFAFDASPGVAAGSRTYADLEAKALESGLQVAVLRYGFFYGPGTWFSRDGDVGEQVGRREVPVIGKGEGIWNWVHIDDAAAATCTALTADPGVFNVVDDEPVPQSVWLPAFAKFVGAPEPPTISEEQGLQSFGPDTVYYATKLRGASNQRAKTQLPFRPRRLEMARRLTTLSYLKRRIVQFAAAVPMMLQLSRCSCGAQRSLGHHIDENVRMTVFTHIGAATHSLRDSRCDRP